MTGPAGRLAAVFIDSKLTPLIAIAAVLAGTLAIVRLPREEEPQIKVPMIDVFAGMPGASPREVEQRLTKPMERLLWEIPGVEYIYSTSMPGQSLAIVRFFTGIDEDEAIVRLNQKLAGNFDLIPPGGTPPLVKRRSIDDVPVLALTLHSSRHSPFELRRVAAEIEDGIRQVTDVSAVAILGGESRRILVTLDEMKLAGHGIESLRVLQALEAGNRRQHAGRVPRGNREFVVESGVFPRDAADVGAVVVGAAAGRPIHLRDIAAVEDGAGEPSQYVFHMEKSGSEAAVTLAISKRRGANAISVADAVLRKVELMRSSVAPAGVSIAVTRNYGETAAEKSNELLKHMGIAVISVGLLIALALGARAAGIVLIAIPVTLALTLLVFWLYGYTLNRITLFALIFSIGILVDDAIVVVENIARHARLPANLGRPLMPVAIEAVDEVGNPTILATLTVIAAILPMAFVGGLMGPYMRPIPVGGHGRHDLLAACRLCGDTLGRRAHVEERWRARG